MKFATIFAGLPLLAAAAPTQRALGDSCMPSQHDLGMPLQDSAFTAFATPRGERGPPIQARGSRFYLGGEPATYCPPQVEPNCPPGKVTAFSGEGFSFGLSVNVPGGQRLYVAPTGELGYTQAHSGYIPPGSLLGPFEYDQGFPYGRWSFSGRPFLACPKDDEWQVYADIPNAIVPTRNINDCQPFDAATEIYFTPPAAWQYT